MAIVMQLQASGLTRDDYDRVLDEVGWYSHPPEGIRMHVCGFDQDGACITDVWDDVRQFEAFFGGPLRAAFERLDLDLQPQMRIAELHAAFTPHGALA